MKRLFSFLPFYLLVLLTPLPARAAGANIIPPVNSASGQVTQVGFPSGYTSALNYYLSLYWTRIINAILLVLGILAIIYLIYSGIQYITAGGSSDKTKNARQGILYALLGIIILVASYFIIDTITSLSTHVASSAG
ncbi:hypothetical protein KGQ71_00465 [Patescibacteria group bacterium]|nr:hypothetical protein [Patescibacteria group bacterium]